MRVLAAAALAVGAIVPIRAAYARTTFVVDTVTDDAAAVTEPRARER
jgi:hypothetical protein